MMKGRPFAHPPSGVPPFLYPARNPGTFAGALGGISNLMNYSGRGTETPKYSAANWQHFSTYSENSTVPNFVVLPAYSYSSSPVVSSIFLTRKNRHLRNSCTWSGVNSSPMSFIPARIISTTTPQ